MRPAVVFLIVGCLAASSAGRAEHTPPQTPAQPQATFRTGVDLVQVDVSVLDKDRRPVRGLTAADFTVREDGKARPVVAFSAVELPERPAAPPATWMRDIAPDVVANTIPREGRLVVIVMDRTIRPEDMPWARRTAGAAVDQLGPGDLAAVIYTNRGVPQNFTADRSLLLAAINRPFVGLPDDGEEGRRGVCRCGLCTLEAMTIVADALREVPHRRKMLLFVGSTVPVQSSSIECSADVREAREKLLRAADVANLTIHTFDSNLLETLAPPAQQRAVPSTDRSGIIGAHLTRQGDLAVYPAHTGGRAVMNTNAPGDLMPAVFEESRSYYVLGFAPANPRADGRFHEIKVSVSRGDVSVHPRQGYYSPVETRASPASPGTPPPSLTGALAGLWPQTGMPLGVTAAAFANPGNAEAVVAVVLLARERLDVERRPDGEPGGARDARVIDVLAGAYDRDGRSLDYHVQTIVVTPPPDGQPEFEYEVLSRLRLKPGRHEIRVAAENVARHSSGSVYTYVDVPDFSKARLSLSGVVLGMSPARRESVLSDLLPLAPTARREFAATDRVRTFLRAYQGGKDPPLAVTMTVRIVDDANRMAFEENSVMSADRFGADRGADFELDLPLDGLAAGQYVLTIDATVAKTSARRDVRFSVR